VRATGRRSIYQFDLHWCSIFLKHAIEGTLIRRLSGHFSIPLLCEDILTMKRSPARKNRSSTATLFHSLTIAVILGSCSLASSAATAVARPALTPSEAKASRAFEQARKAGPLTLRAFLFDMPKGADLHSHLSGAVYAESWIRAAGEDGLCVNESKLSFEKAPANTMTQGTQPDCGEGNTAASRVAANQGLYDALVDAFSMRSFVPTTGTSGHDHFFDTFGHFSGTSHVHFGEWLDEVATRAALQNEQYLELMETPDFSHTLAIAKELGWNPDLPKLRTDLLTKGLHNDVAGARDSIEEALARRNELEKCGTPNASPACQVEIRFLYQVLRGFPPERVFAQTVLAFETVSAFPEFVGLNFVMPEDGFLSMKDYRLQMQMLDYLHSVYPKVHIALHAGELAPGLVPPDGLTFHIRSAVEQGHAERIGHGVDLIYEEHPYELLKQMAEKHTLVEVNLTSNDVILGIEGANHPLQLYRKYGVPVTLSTDDEGVSRIDLTHEYERAAMTYPLSYSDLKTMVQASLEHSFLPGKSLWNQPDDFTRAVQPCAGQALGAFAATGACSSFLQANEKAKQQWELERRFRAFETKQ
jgi:adenosine deaminase